MHTGVCRRDASGCGPGSAVAGLWAPEAHVQGRSKGVWLKGAAGGLFLLQARPEERVAQARKTPVFWFLRRARLGAVTAGRPALRPPALPRVRGLPEC